VCAKKTQFTRKDPRTRLNDWSLYLSLSLSLSLSGRLYSLILYFTLSQYITHIIYASYIHYILLLRDIICARIIIMWIQFMLRWIMWRITFLIILQQQKSFGGRSTDRSLRRVLYTRIRHGVHIYIYISY